MRAAIKLKSPPNCTVFSITRVQLSVAVAGGPLRIMSHYLGRDIKWGKCYNGMWLSIFRGTAVPWELNCIPTGQEWHGERSREAGDMWVHFSLPTHAVMRDFFFIWNSIRNIWRQPSRWQVSAKATRCVDANPQILPAWGRWVLIWAWGFQGHKIGLEIIHAF